MISGGLGLTLIPPSLFSRREISFFSPDSGTFSSQFHPLGGGPPVTPILSIARSSHTQTTLLDGRVLVTGGLRNAGGTSPGTPFEGVEVFDPQTGLVSIGPPMSEPRAMHTATLLGDGRVVVAGGGSWQVFLPESNTWQPATSLAHPRTAHAAVLLPDFAGPRADRVLLIAGAGTGPATLELLDPDGGGVRVLSATLSVGVDDLAAARMEDGRVLIVGGQDLVTGDTIELTYVLDVEADAITPAPPPPGLRAGIADHRIACLGRYVAIFGGEQQAAGVDTELDYAAIYDSESGDWVSNGTMPSARDDFALVALADGSLLLADGGVGLLNFEVPTPACVVFRLVLGTCAGDVDGDGDTDQGDLGILLASYGLSVPRGTQGDLDRNGQVDQSDLGILLGDYPCGG